jgi:hypothetical protein
MSGWCPRHDHVFATASSSCPECGTALVPIAEPAQRPRRSLQALDPGDFPEPGEPVAGRRPRSRPRWAPGAIVGAAIGIALASGILLPNAARETGPAEVADAPVVLDLAVNRSTRAGGIVLQLDEVVQRGRRFLAGFSVRQGFEAVRIERAEVAVVVGRRDSAATTLPLGSLPVRATAAGFEVSAELPGIDQPLRSVSVTGLQVSVAGAARWRADVSSIWPASASNEPRVLRLRQDRPLDERVISLVFLLGWRDRMEALLDVSDLNRNQRIEYVFGEYRVSWRDPATGGLRVEHEVGARGPVGQLELEFAPFPPAVREVVIEVLRPSKLVDGIWSWTLPVKGL